MAEQVLRTPLLRYSATRISSQRRSLGFETPLFSETGKVVVVVIYVLHRVCDDPVAGLVVDEPMHLLSDPAISGVARSLAPQLQEMERLSCVHLEVVADPVCERNRVLGNGRAVSC